MNTDLLQVRLVAKLPDRIAQMRGAIRWIEGEQRRVLDTEWDYIVRMVEDAMTMVQKDAYIAALVKQVCPYDLHFIGDWQQRAQAMVDCGII